jgi:hypothetical protein
LWLAIGALIGVGVLIAGGVYIPRHVGTHADPNKAMLPANSSNAAPGGTSTNSQVAPATDAAANPAAPIVSLQSDKGSLTVDANGNVSMQSPQGSMQVDAKTGAVRMSDNSGAAATAVHSKPTGTAMSKGNLAPAGSGATQTDSTPAAPAGPSAEELAKMEDDADKLNIRAATVSHSLDTLRQQQNAAGYSLRADMASAQERMQAYLAKGNAALAAKDIVNAQKYFDLADREASKLEKFLGH